ncbi:MAG TPA: hypothetical protein VLA48_03330 [Nitrososphaeraceae archaeon]|nr:hypothetical protein [Nitrososphaeraceae archaeon]
MNIKNCYTGTAIKQIEEGCKGSYISTNCIQTPNAISYLDLPAGSSQTEVNAAITSSLLFKDQQISEISATKIEAGENIDITGIGTEEQPYVINSLGGEQGLQSILDINAYAVLSNKDLNISFGNINGRHADIIGFFDSNYPGIQLRGFDENNSIISQLSINSGLTSYALEYTGKDIYFGTVGNGSLFTNSSGINIEGQAKGVTINGQSGEIKLINKNSNYLFDLNKPVGTYTLATLDDIYKISNLQTYPDNASAISGGLIVDNIYKTSTGELRIVI